MSGVAIIVLTTLWATLSYRLASKRGRRPVLWAAISVVFGLLSLGLLALLPSRTEPVADGDLAAA